jgi:hypothetical protein
MQAQSRGRRRLSRHAFERRRRRIGRCEAPDLDRIGASVAVAANWPTARALLGQAVPSGQGAPFGDSRRPASRHAIRL